MTESSVSLPLLQARGLTRTFRTRRGEVEALRGVDLDVGRGEVLVLRGVSGAGKTTLLLALGGLARPDAGSVHLLGSDLYGVSSGQRRGLRRAHVGFVFQTMHLVPYLDAAGNVSLGGGQGRWLAELGLEGRAHHRPDQLSAGERQRVALARALAAGPDLILADEPTGNLDPESAAVVCRALEAYRSNGGSVVMVTHAEALELEPDRELRLEAGVLAG